MPEELVTCDRIAARLNLTERSVWRLVKKGRLEDGTEFPSRVEGRSRKFPSDRCFEWYVRYKQEEALKRIAPAAPADLDEAELRKATADAELKEHKLARLRGEVVPVEDYRRELERVLGNVRNTLRAAPMQYASRLPVEMPVGVKLLREILYDVEKELAQSGKRPALALVSEGEEADTPEVEEPV